MGREVAIIGAGKVGTALGSLLAKKDFRVAAVACRSLDKAIAAQAYTGGIATRDVVEAAKSAEVVFLSTNDDQIEQVCEKISRGGGIVPGGYVFHFSGALSLDVLDPARKCGAAVGCIHPLQSFADVEEAIFHLRGSFFGVTAAEGAAGVAREIVEALEGKYLPVEEKDKPLYHSAACVVSNYLVSLLNLGEEIMAAAGIPESAAREALGPLVAGTMENIRTRGPVEALTGPISRGDLGTLEAQLAELSTALPHRSNLYRELGCYTAEIALRKGTIDRSQYEHLIQLLSKQF